MTQGYKPMLTRLAECFLGSVWCFMKKKYWTCVYYYVAPAGLGGYFATSLGRKSSGT